LAERQAAALRADLHRKAAAVVAGDGAGTGRGLVEHRPAGEVVLQLALERARLRGRGCGETDHRGNGEARQGKADVHAWAPSGDGMRRAAAASEATAPGRSAGDAASRNRAAASPDSAGACVSCTQVTW